MESDTEWIKKKKTRNYLYLYPIVAYTCNNCTPVSPRVLQLQKGEKKCNKSFPQTAHNQNSVSRNDNVILALIND